MMRAVVQRVTSAHVSVANRRIGEIDTGLVAFIGIAAGDADADAEYIARKIQEVRVFRDNDKPMARSVTDVGGAVLVVSQFTLYGDCRKGRRPSFDRAAPAEEAKRLYERVVAKLSESGLTVQTGEFQAMMQVELVNDGPVTLLLDSERQF